jgi:hypothetical protein
MKFSKVAAGAVLAFASCSAFAQGGDGSYSVQTLADQVKELTAAVQELRAENLAIREELRRALGGSSEPEPARLAQIEENQQLLQNKVDEQYQTKIESASKYRMKLSGIVLLNVFGNRGRVDNQDVPNFALRRGQMDTGGDFGATARQSQIGFEVYGPRFAGATASADLHLDFFGGFPDTPNGSTTGLVRLRTTTMRLDWQRTSIIAGQDAPFFSPLSPTSIASLGYPAFSYSGNLWTWLPQARVQHRLPVSASQSLSIEGGILDPLVGDMPYAQSYRTPQAGERSRQPAYASRIAYTRSVSDETMSLGVGGYYSRQDYGAGRTVDGWSGTADWNIPIFRRFAVSGEFYRGRGIGGLGGAQDRSVISNGPQDDPATSIRGLNAIGGWTQVKVKATDSIEFNASYGEDHPFAADLRRGTYSGPGQYSLLLSNRSGLLNVLYRPRTDLVFSLEYRRLDSLRITKERNTANHINLGVGVLF